MTRPDVLIVGGGVIGCAVAYELAKDGLRVTLLERAGLCAGRFGSERRPDLAPGHAPRRRLSI